MARCAWLRRSAAALWLAATAVAAAPQGENQGTLGLCPDGVSRLDGYMQALCEGERALATGDLRGALKHFRLAAELPRINATNELAWAGLAAAYCRARELDAGRLWAAHFGQARQLWLGELDCTAGGDDPRARISPFVRSRMCGENVAADYSLVRASPASVTALDLQRRLTRVSHAVDKECSVDSTAPARDSGQASSAAASKPSEKKPGRRAGKGKTNAPPARPQKAD